MSDRKLILENIASQQQKKTELYEGEITRRSENPKWDGISKREKEESPFYTKKDGAWQAVKLAELQETIKQTQAITRWCEDQIKLTH